MRDNLRKQIEETILKYTAERYACHEDYILDVIEPLIDAEIEQQREQAIKNHCSICTGSFLEEEALKK